MHSVEHFILLFVFIIASGSTSVFSSNLTISGEYTSNQCHIDIDKNSLDAARKIFKQYLKDKYLINIFLCQTEKCEHENISELTIEQQCDRNRIQQWIWIKKEEVYQGLKFPVDLDTVTFSLSSIKTEEILIKFNFSSGCNATKVINQTKTEELIVRTLQSDVTGNISDSLLCHRSCKKTHKGTDLAWIITTVWIGYDFDCFYLNDGVLNPKHTCISKYDNTIILTYVLCLLAYMHPLLLLIIENNQIPDHKLNKYYRKNIHSDTPYSLNRLVQKLFFGKLKHLCELNIYVEFFKGLKTYYSVLLFYLFLAFPLYILPLYQLIVASVIHPVWKSAEIDFPNVYRYGSVEYRHIFTAKWSQIIHANLDYIAFFICNICIYIIYNREDDFIISIPNIFSIYKSHKTGCDKRCNLLLVPINDILNDNTTENEENNDSDSIVANSTETKENNDSDLIVANSTKTEENNDSDLIVANSTETEKKNGSDLNVAKKLLIRFYLLFSSKFWKNIFTHSFGVCSNCSNTSSCSSCGQVLPKWCILIPTYATGLVIFIFNVTINIIFCTLPALWFLVFIFVSFVKHCYSLWEKKGDTKFLNVVGILCVTLIYGFTLRGQISYFIFFLRALTYGILIAFTSTDQVLKIYITVLSSVVYCLTFIKQFLRTYTLLLEKMFDIEDKESPQSICKQRSGTDEVIFEIFKNDVEDKVIEEDLFDYVIDNCYSVQKRVFFLIIKTVITSIFFMVTIFILVDTNKLYYLNFDNSLTLLFIFITPKLIVVFADNDPKIDIDNHEDQIKTLIEKFKRRPNPDSNRNFELQDNNQSESFV